MTQPYNTMITLLAVCLLLVACIIVVVLIIDPFGLIRKTKGRRLSVIYNERLTKYLFSLRYIPSNFEGAFIGTSLSDNLDVNTWNKGSRNLRFYNASIMGANMAMLHPLAMNLVNGGIRNLIVCLSPYSMKASTAAKPVRVRSKIFHALFDIKSLLTNATVWTIRKLNLRPNKFPKDQFDSAGVNHYYNLFEKKDIHQKISEVIADNEHKKLEIHPTSLKLFDSLLNMMDAKNVKYLIYLHPLPVDIYQSKLNEYIHFRDEVAARVDRKKLIDFNDVAYQEFTTDYTNYLDHGHLSEKGQSLLLSIIMGRFFGSVESSRHDMPAQVSTEKLSSTAA